MAYKPIIGILLGDSAGVGPELVARLAVDGELTDDIRPVIIGDERIFKRGLSVWGKDLEYQVVDNIDDINWENKIAILDQKDQDPAKIPMGCSTAYCGKAIINMITVAVELSKAGKIEGFSFAPLNKNAMKLAGLKQESEDWLMADLFGVTGEFGEISVLDDVITTRTTSHIPIKNVSQTLTVDRILKALRLCNRTLVEMGKPNGKIGVAALNPHAGENGTCGREEIDVIRPAIEEAVKAGINASGPYSADTMFNRAFAGDFDGVVTMFHDQGQIALKVKGFERGVTISGGQPVPVITCSHGSAYDIAGKGIVNKTSFENAVRFTARMCRTRHENRKQDNE